MSLHFATPQPRELLAAIKSAIIERRVETWLVDTDGDFTHSPDQWRHRAWLRPTVRTDELILTTIKPNNVSISREVYAIYHGRFAEMALAHFDNRFQRVWATALPRDGDLV